MEDHLEIKDADRPNICATCGTRYSREHFQSDTCPICEDDRQYVPINGQQWISFDALKDKHKVTIRSLRENIHELFMTPSFAIGQKAHLIETAGGNILWDCLPLLDEDTCSFIKSKGGLKAIAISHPHYYSLMIEWARYFDCPIYLQEKDRQWVMDADAAIQFWEGDRLPLFSGLTLIRPGGHFPGSTVLHYAEKEGGMLFTGDTLYLSHDKKHISAMYSYPNVIPLAPATLFEVFEKLSDLKFDHFYGAFLWQNIHNGAKEVFINSLKRYHQIYD